MSIQKQIIDAVRLSDLEQLQHLLDSNTNPDKDIVAVQGLKKACEINNVACMSVLLPYAAKFYNRPPTIISGSEALPRMSMHPSSALGDLLYSGILPNNSVEGLKVFTTLLTSQPHHHHCAPFLVQCFERGHFELIDVLLPHMSDLSIVAQYKPRAYQFFEERKAVHQNAKLSDEVAQVSAPKKTRKM